MNNSKARTFSSKTEKYLDWEEYISLVCRLGELIRESAHSIDYIHGVPRGGLVPAVILSHTLGIPILSNFMDGKDGTVLIVDDLVDTGKTVIDLITIRKHMDVLVGTLYKHKKCKVFPDFFVEENDYWVHFPYEKVNVNE